MRINKLTYIPSFRAKLSTDVKESLDEMGWFIEQEDGKNSIRYKQFEKDVLIIKNCCPNRKVCIKKSVDLYGYPYYDFMLKKGFDEPIYMGFHAIDKNEDLFSEDNLSVLSSQMQAIDEEEGGNSEKEQASEDKKSIFQKFFGLFLR